ncbi:MAG: hypothetical protein GWP06_06130 [Actinobacteria bacterium]|nr:hypothetical protein [Actinomycetota bacterium]
MENLPTTNQSMTISDVAIVLNVTDRTIRRYVEKLFPGHMVNGQTTYLSEMHVTAVKFDLEKNKHLDTSVQLPRTELEKKLLIQQAIGFLNEEIEELKYQLKDAQPKIEFHDQVGSSAGLYSMGEAAKMLGTGRNRLFSKLRIKKVFFGIVPFQDFINRGYFEVKTTSVNSHVQSQSFVTPKGLQWLQRQF